MNHWPYIIAAYCVTAAGTVMVTAMSYIAMRRAEKKVDDL